MAGIGGVPRNGPELRKIRAFYKTDGPELRKIRAFYKTDGPDLRKIHAFYKTDGLDLRKIRAFFTLNSDKIGRDGGEPRNGSPLLQF